VKAKSLIRFIQYLIFGFVMPLPFSASSLIKQMSPRRAGYPSFSAVNRFAFLSREDSPGPVDRGRTNSFKRKNQEGSSYAEITGGSRDPQQPGTDSEANNAVWIGEVSTEIAKVESICDKFVSEASQPNIDPNLIPIFGLLSEAMKGICNVQKSIVMRNTGTDRNATESNFVSLGAVPKKQRPMFSTGSNTLQANANPGYDRLSQNSSQKNSALGSGAAGASTGTGTGAGAGQGPGRNEGSRSNLDPSNHQPRVVRSRDNSEEVEELVEDPLEKKFREAIKDAEKSTLMFNLDMGRVPVMNTETMRKRATLALTAMAAAKEKKNGPVPSPETIEALDDVLSLVNNMELYGDTTKTYRHPTDKNSGLFCTVPVRYDFQDKDTRIRAEAILRKSCGVQCATPYPPFVKECIRQLVQRVKRQFPDNYVKVHVDTRDMVFLVARNPPKDDPDPGWKYRIGDIPIPREVMDLRNRRVPKGWVLPIPVREEGEEESPTPYRTTKRPPVPISTKKSNTESPLRAESSMELENNGE
jgi:hypothetical protein